MEYPLRFYQNILEMRRLVGELEHWSAVNREEANKHLSLGHPCLALGYFYFAIYGRMKHAKYDRILRSWETALPETIWNSR